MTKEQALAELNVINDRCQGIVDRNLVDAKEGNSISELLVNCGQAVIEYNKMLARQAKQIDELKELLEEANILMGYNEDQYEWKKKYATINNATQ